jgi:hypothetical protein
MNLRKIDYERTGRWIELVEDYDQQSALVLVVLTLRVLLS